MIKVENKIWGEALWKDAQGRDGLGAARALAWKRFCDLGFPTKTDEAWKYTSLSGMTAATFQTLLPAKPNTRVLEHVRQSLSLFRHCARLVFLDGWFVPQISDLKPLGDVYDFSSAKDLAANRPEALIFEVEKADSLSAMNAALFQDGAWFHLRPGCKAQAPLLVYFLHASQDFQASAQIRNWISIGENAKLELTEWHDSLSDSDLFWNQQTQFDLAEGATLEHVRLQKSGAQTWALSTSEVNLSAKSHYQRLDVELGARVSRNDLRVALQGEQAVCELKGMAIGGGVQHFDTQVTAAHISPGASSDQVYRNLLAGKSRGVFGGRVQVGKAALKTEAHQVHKTLLLSTEARADAKPQLEIDTDDVQCSHGAAMGQLDEDSLFYLRSRGISSANAEKMLAAGFVEKLLDSVKDEVLHSFLSEQLKEKLKTIF